MSKICDTSFLFCVVLSRPYFTESKSLFFFHFGHLLNIIVSVPRTPITVPLWTIFASKCPCFFLCKGARLASDRHSGGSSEPSVCSTGGDSASVLGEGGGRGGLYCIAAKLSDGYNVCSFSKFFCYSGKSAIFWVKLKICETENKY